jgi:subtilisin
MWHRLLTIGLAVVLMVTVAPALAASGSDILLPEPSTDGEAGGAHFIGTSTPDPSDPMWIVTLASNAPAAAVAPPLAKSHEFTVRHIYRHALNGFAFSGSQQAADALARNPNVLSIEPVRGFSATVESGSNGLFRIDGNLTYSAGDRGRTVGGTPVRIAILDTGIMTTHPDLAPNLDLAQSINCISPGTTPEDDQGHGTHVAGSAAAADQGEGLVGVASQATIVVAKVLNSAGSGTDAEVICGLDHIAGLAGDGIPTVVNLSLGESHAAESADCASSAMHQAICNLEAAGVTIVAAAGNTAENAATFYPAAYAETIAVSAFSDLNGNATNGGCAFFIDLLNQCDETLASFTNYGSVIDVTAPGVRILSTTFDGESGLNSGTSMAAPFAAGVAALILAADPTLSPDEVRAILQATGECPDGSTAGGPTCAGHGQWQMSSVFSGTVADPDGIPEPLINAFAAVEAATPSTSDTTPPVVTITAPADGATYEAGVDVVTVDFTCSDTESGIASCSGDAPDGSTLDTSTPATGLTFSVTGTDNAANMTTVTNTYDVVDTTPPVITLIGDDPLLHEVGTPFTDPGAQVTDNVDATSTITGVSTVDPDVPGEYAVTYDYTDAAGNPATQVVRSVHVIEILDVAAPSLVIDGPAGASQVVSPVSLVGSASDDVGVAQVQVSIRDQESLLYWNGSGWQAGWTSVVADLSSPGSSLTGWVYEFDLDGLDASSVGYTWIARAVDTSGKASPWSASNFKIVDVVDVAAPSLVIDGPAGASQVVSPVSLVGSASDDVGVAQVQVSIRDQESLLYWNGSGWQAGWTSVVADLSSPGSSLTGWVYEFDLDGLDASSVGYTWIARAVDTSGKASPWSASNFKIVDVVDVAAPSLVIDGPAGASQVVSPVSLVGSASDDVGVAQVQVSIRDQESLLYWNGSGWQAGWTSVVADLSSPGSSLTGWVYEFDLDGLDASSVGYTWIARAVDTSGKASPWSASNFKIVDVVDVAAPSLVIDGPAGASQVVSPVSLVGSASDDVGVAQVQVSIRDQESLLYWNGSGWQAGWTSVVADLSSPGSSLTGWVYEFDLDGLDASSVGYTWIARAVDTSGKASPWSASNFKIVTNDDTEILS